MTKKLSIFQIILKDDIKTESYRVNEVFFITIRKMLAPYRSVVAASKSIRCIESGEIFKNANRVKTWLLKNNITKSKNADAVIKSVCKGQRLSAYGYHWEFVEEK